MLAVVSNPTLIESMINSLELSYNLVVWFSKNMMVPNCDVDDEMPQDAIRRMGAGFIRPVEEPLVADREEQCSTQVEPSSSQHQQARAIE